MYCTFSLWWDLQLFWLFWPLYGFVYNLETIGVSNIMIWWFICKKETILSFARNLNSGHSYHITYNFTRISMQLQNYSGPKNSESAAAYYCLAAFLIQDQISAQATQKILTENGRWTCFETYHFRYIDIDMEWDYSIY